MFILTKALEIIIRTSEIENDSVLDGTVLTIANMQSIWSKLIQIAGKSREFNLDLRQLIPDMRAFIADQSRER